jgi:hypothetical protein
MVAILNPKCPPKYKNPPIWTKFGFQVDYDVVNWYPLLVCYGGHFECKMAAKIQKSSDLDEIWFPVDYDDANWYPSLVCYGGHFESKNWYPSLVVKLSMVSDFNENWYLGVFWSEKLVGNDETWIHIPKFWYGGRLGTSVFASKHNQT